jgi:hypothetical protein
VATACSKSAAMALVMSPSVLILKYRPVFAYRDALLHVVWTSSGTREDPDAISSATGIFSLDRIASLSPH